jgi:hypothetical protein
MVPGIILTSPYPNYSDLPPVPMKMKGIIGFGMEHFVWFLAVLNKFQEASINLT